MTVYLADDNDPENLAFRIMCLARAGDAVIDRLGEGPVVDGLSGLFATIDDLAATLFANLSDAKRGRDAA